jgi:hypothetical protein
MGRASWGDPLADWTFFLLSRRASPQEQALFWQAYGQPESGPGEMFRAQVYQGLHRGQNLAGRQAGWQQASSQQGLSRSGRCGERAPVRTCVALLLSLERCLHEQRERSRHDMDMRWLTVTIKASPRSINQSYAVWNATAPQPTCCKAEQQYWHAARSAIKILL